MLILSSPAKRLDFDTKISEARYSQPVYLSEAAELVQMLAKQGKKKLAKTLEVSESLAELNYDRFQAWNKSHDPDNSRQAIWAYQGDVFHKIDQASFSKSEKEYAQGHLIIVSGLYGLLKPYDLIQPYRLEMKLSIKNSRGKNLHEYWKKQLTSDLDKEINKHDHKLIVSAASQEYVKAIDRKALGIPFYQVKFKQMKDGKAKSIMLYSKHARGMMINYLIKSQAKSLEQVKQFNVEGYKFVSEEKNILTFVKP